MAKNPIPKKVAGYKIPKSVRKSKTLRSMLSSPLGREIAANALTAGAGAAAAALVRRRDDIGAAAKKSGRAFGVVGDAISDGANAMMAVVSDAAHSGRSEKDRLDKRSRDDARH